MKFFSLPLLLSIIFCSSSFAQYSSNYDYTVAAKVYTNIQIPRIFNQNTQRFVNSYLKSAMVKLNDNQMSFRLTGYYLKQQMQFTDDCINCELADGKVTDYAIKLGFEKNLSYAKVQPYIGIDLGYRNNAFTGNLNAIDIQKSVVAVNRIEATKSGFTLGPLAGIKLNLLPMLSLFAEGSLEFFYSYERRQTVTLDAAAVKTFNNTYQTEFLLNPISVGLQLHLSRKD